MKSKRKGNNYFCDYDSGLNMCLFFTQQNMKILFSIIKRPSFSLFVERNIIPNRSDRLLLCREMLIQLYIIIGIVSISFVVKNIDRFFLKKNTILISLNWAHLGVFKPSCLSYKTFWRKYKLHLDKLTKKSLFWCINMSEKSSKAKTNLKEINAPKMSILFQMALFQLI